MDRYELDYNWKWRDKTKLDIEVFEMEGQITGFRKVNDGDWVKYTDAAKLQSENERLKKYIYMIMFEYGFYTKNQVDEKLNKYLQSTEQEGVDG